MIWAILRVQMLSLRRAGWGRNAGTWLAALPVLAYLTLWTLFAFGAWALAQSAETEATFRVTLGGFYFGIFLYWQIAPVITASMGASLDLQKLIVYPINLDKLFLTEVMLRFLTVTEMLLLLAGTSLGAIENPLFGDWMKVPVFLLVLALFILFNLLVAAGVRSGMEQFFSNKRRREWGMLVFVLLCAAPAAVAHLQIPVAKILPYLPVDLFWPWGAPAQVALTHQRSVIGMSSLLLAGWIALAYIFGRRQFYRALRVDPYAGHEPAPAGKQRDGSWATALFELPARFLPDPLAAMVEKDLLSLSRTSGFRLAFFMGFTFGVIIFVPNMGSRHTGMIGQHFLAWVSIYSALLIGSYTFWNAFGCDRSAASFYFCAPVSFQRVLLAKNIAAGTVQFVELLMLTLVTRVLPFHFDVGGVLEAFAVTVIVCIYLFAFGNLTSVRYASPINPDKMSRGSGSRAKTLLSMLVLPLALAPVGLAYWGRAVFHSEPIFYLLLLVAGLIGAVFYWVATDSAVQMSVTYRERMLSALSKGQGPVAAG